MHLKLCTINQQRSVAAMQQSNRTANLLMCDHVNNLAITEHAEMLQESCAGSL